MKKLVCIVLTCLSISTISFSQDSSSLYKSVPVHFVKVDIFKTLFSQIHFDFERYNGKKGAFEIGAGLYYPHPVLYSINRGISKKQENPCAFQYLGFGIELKRKLYFPKKRWNPYLAPGVCYKYKFINNESVLVNGEKNSSYGTYYQVSRQMNVFGVFGSAGFMSKLNNGASIDVNIGIGMGYLQTNTTIDDYGKYENHSFEMSGYNKYTELLGQLSIKVCAGFKKK
jgi:hypothetical protein